MHHTRLAAALLSYGLLAACAAVPGKRDVSTSEQLRTERSTLATPVSWQTAITPEQLHQFANEPLDADGCVRVALLGSPKLRQLYAHFGLTQAEVYDATTLANPTLSLSVLRSGDESRRTWTLTQQFTDVLFMGYRHQQGRSQWLQAQQQLAQSVLELEAEVRTAYYRYVVAQTTAQLVEREAMVASVTRDYAGTLRAAGNLGELQFNQFAAEAAEMQILVLQIRNEAARERAQLMTLLGVTQTDQPLQLLEQLDIPASLSLDATSLVSYAEQQRVDVVMLEERLKQLDGARKHTRRWFWLDDAQVSVEREREANGSVWRGPGGSVGLPLFNRGSGKRLRAQSLWEETAAELQTRKLDLHNRIPVQVAALMAQKQSVDSYRQQIVPLRERIIELTQQEHNAMLIGTAELLRTRREYDRAQRDYLQAIGQYWLDYVALSQSVGGKLPEQTGDPREGVTTGVEVLP